jgi:hypothetical protein
LNIDVYAKSTQLLERLANSIYDRDSISPNPFFFKASEITVVEDWVRELIEEVKMKVLVEDRLIQELTKD